MNRPLLRKAAQLHSNATRLGRRFASEGPSKPRLPPKPPFQERTRQRLDSWITRSPRFFKPTLSALRDAPASYIVSFAILHELTAVIPLAGLFWYFHHYRWLPPYFAEGKWAVEGVEKFGRYFRRKGWITEQEEAKVEEDTRTGRAKQVQKRVSWFWDNGEHTSRVVVEAATAWAVIKMLLPLRIVLSVWWAPPFSRLTSTAFRITSMTFRRAPRQLRKGP
jgi:Hypothetical protein FLILHELTA